MWQPQTVIVCLFTLQSGPFSPPRSGLKDVSTHIKRPQTPRQSILDQPYEEREEMPIASFLKAWENSNWADYCVLKEKGGAPWDLPTRELLSWWTLLWWWGPQWVKLGKSGPACTSEMALESQVKSKDSSGRSWLEGVPDPREWKTTSLPPYLWSKI